MFRGWCRGEGWLGHLGGLRDSDGPEATTAIAPFQIAGPFFGAAVGEEQEQTLFLCLVEYFFPRLESDLGGTGQKRVCRPSPDGGV